MGDFQFPEFQIKLISKKNVPDVHLVDVHLDGVELKLLLASAAATDLWKNQI